MLPRFVHIIITRLPFIHYLFISAICTHGALRLVGGSTDREGRVEVCVGGRVVVVGGQFALAVRNWQEPFVHKWDTPLKVTEWIDKCAMNDPSTESTVANSFPPGAFPEYRLNCTQLSNGAWHCSPVEQQCDSFVELGVVCIEL